MIVYLQYNENNAAKTPTSLKWVKGAKTDVFTLAEVKMFSVIYSVPRNRSFLTPFLPTFHFVILLRILF